MKHLALVLILGAAALAQPTIDNERVVVWDKGGPATATMDTVRIDFAGKAEVIGKGKKLPPAELGKSVLIELRDNKVAPLANTTKYPNAFPRPNVMKVLENDRVLVWNYTWTPGVPTPMHFHDKDVVVIYMETGALKSTTPTGEETVNDLTPGMIRFNKRDRVHTEVLARGKSHAMMMELK